MLFPVTIYWYGWRSTFVRDCAARWQCSPICMNRRKCHYIFSWFTAKQIYGELKLNCDMHHSRSSRLNSTRTIAFMIQVNSGKFFRIIVLFYKSDLCNCWHEKWLRPQQKPNAVIPQRNNKWNCCVLSSFSNAKPLFESWQLQMTKRTDEIHFGYNSICTKQSWQKRRRQIRIWRRSDIFIIIYAGEI